MMIYMLILDDTTDGTCFIHKAFLHKEDAERFTETLRDDDVWLDDFHIEEMEVIE